MTGETEGTFALVLAAKHQAAGSFLEVLDVSP
jgi:hypothetical protein